MSEGIDTTSMLEKSDEETIAARAIRLDWLVHLDSTGDRGILFKGGHVAAIAFAEMQQCYVCGAYLSCVFTAQVFLEHELTGSLELFGRDIGKKSGFAKLCNLACKEGFVSAADLDRLNELRKHRNPYAHPQPFLSDSCFVRRSLDSETDPYEIAKNDAEQAIEIAYRLVARL